MRTKDVLSKLTPEKIETKTSNNQIMVEEKASYKDQKPQKVCKKLKAKNNEDDVSNYAQFFPGIITEDEKEDEPDEEPKGEPNDEQDVES